MPDIKILNPECLGKPLGQYSQLARVKAAEFLFIAGQVGAGKDGNAPAAIRSVQSLSIFKVPEVPMWPRLLIMLVAACPDCTRRVQAS